MAQAVNRWPLTAEARVRTQVSPCGICDGQSGTGYDFLRVLQGFLLVIIPPLFPTHLSPDHEVCDSSDQAAHYHTLDPKFEASPLTRHLVGLGVK
jgi:hypothetical protein